ncbi:MAG: MFS transporter [Lachnospiraceae bacterium]|jgi:MFS family permease|nr:MFS transporter [Lachnospiraceae bacterium]
MKPRLLSAPFVILFFCLFAAGFSLYCLNAIVPVYVGSIGGAAGFSGLLNTCFTLSACAARLGGGHLADRFGRRPVIIFGGVALVACTASYHLFDSLWPLMLLRGMQGVGYAMMTVGASAALVDVLPKARLGEGIGLSALASTLAASIAPTAALAIVSRFDFGAVFAGSALVSAAGMLPLLFGGMRLRPETRQTDAPSDETGHQTTANPVTVGGPQTPEPVSATGPQTHPGHTTATSSQITAKPTTAALSGHASAPHAPAAGAQAGGQSAFPWNLLERDALKPAVLYTMFATGFSITHVFMTLYAISARIPNPGSYFIASSLCQVVARVGAGRYTDRGRVWPVVASGGLLGLASYLLLALSAGATPFILSGAMFGAASGLISPALNRLAVMNAQPERRGVASATYFISADIGNGLGGLIWGVAIDAFPYHICFSLAAAWMSVASCAAIFSLRKRP